MICCNDVKLQQCDKRNYQKLAFADVIILTDVSEGVGRSARVGTVCIPSSSSAVYLDLSVTFKAWSQRREKSQGPQASQVYRGLCTSLIPCPVISI